MAGTSSKTEIITLRVPIALAAEWRAAATKGGVKVGALVIDLAKRGLRLSTKVVGPAAADSAVPVLHRQIEELNYTGDAMRKAIQAKDARIAVLEREIIARAKPISGALAALRADPAMKAIDPKVHHVSGPVLADAVPREVSGQAVGFNPKKSWKTDDDKGKKQ